MKIDTETIKQARFRAGQNWAYLSHIGMRLVYTDHADFCRDFIFSVCEHLEKHSTELSAVQSDGSYNADGDYNEE